MFWVYRRLIELHSQQKVIYTFVTVNEKVAEPSYYVVLRIVKAGKPCNDN